VLLAYQCPLVEEINVLYKDRLTSAVGNCMNSVVTGMNAYFRQPPAPISAQPQPPIKLTVYLNVKKINWTPREKKEFVRHIMDK